MASELGKRLNRQELSNFIWAELDRSVDYAAQTLRSNRRKAWRYYYNRKRGDEVSGRSTVQDTSVRDTVHAMKASIMPAYGGDHIVQFEPEGPDDLDQSDAESRAVNNLFTETNQGYLQLDTAVHDALLMRNGIIKVWIKDLTEVSHQKRQAPPAEVIAGAPEGEDWQLIETDDQGISTFSVKARRQKLEVECVEPAYFYVDPNQQDQQIQDASFLAEMVFYTRSELIELGVPKKIVAELPHTPDKTASSQVAWSGSDQREKLIDGIHDIHAVTTADREVVECYWCHMHVDRDGDGISEKWRFLVANRDGYYHGADSSGILLEDPVDYFPYATGVAFPVPHRWSGLSVYDLLRITQDERTNARRQLADNLNVANNQRPVLDFGQLNNREGVENSAPGRPIDTKRPDQVGWAPIQDIVSNSVAFLQYMDGVRDEQAGAALSMQSADSQLISHASGISVDMQLAPREQMAAMVSKNTAETLVRNVFLLIHMTLRNEWLTPIMFEKSGDWIETHPAEWRPRTRLNVAVGLSPGERRRRVQALQYVHQMQMQMIMGGTANITTTWNGVHKALVDWMNAAELDGHEGYFLDPDGEESRMGQQAASQQAQADAEQAAQLQALQQQLEQLDKQLEEAKIREDARQHDTELRFKYWETMYETEAETERAELSNQERGEPGGPDRTGAAASQNGASRGNSG